MTPAVRSALGGARRVLRRLRSLRSLLLVAVAVVAGVAVPGGGPYVEPLVTPLVAFLVYGSVRDLRPGDVDVRAYAGLIALALGLSYVAVPFVGLRIARGLLADGALVGAGIVLAAPATAGSAIVWTRLSGGDSGLAAAASVVSLVAAPLVTPVLLDALLGVDAAVPVADLFVDIGLVVVGGLLAARVVPRDAVSGTAVDRATGAAILLLIYAAVATAAVGAVTPAALGALALFAALVLAGGGGVSVALGRGLGLGRRLTLPLFFAGHLKNLGIALLVAVAVGPPAAVLAVVTYYVASQVAGALVADAVG